MRKFLKALLVNVLTSSASAVLDESVREAVRNRNKKRKQRLADSGNGTQHSHSSFEDN